jgi:hypothetical protein
LHLLILIFCCKSPIDRLNARCANGDTSPGIRPNCAGTDGIVAGVCPSHESARVRTCGRRRVYDSCILSAIQTTILHVACGEGNRENQGKGNNCRPLYPRSTLGVVRKRCTKATDFIISCMLALPGYGAPFILPKFCQSGMRHSG